MSHKKKAEIAEGAKGGGYRPLNEGYVPLESGDAPSTPYSAKVVRVPKGGSGASASESAKK